MKRYPHKSRAHWSPRTLVTPSAGSTLAPGLVLSSFSFFPSFLSLSPFLIPLSLPFHPTLLFQTHYHVLVLWDQGQIQICMAGEGFTHITSEIFPNTLTFVIPFNQEHLLILGAPFTFREDTTVSPCLVCSISPFMLLLHSLKCHAEPTLDAFLVLLLLFKRRNVFLLSYCTISLKWTWRDSMVAVTYLLKLFFNIHHTHCL